MNNTYVSQKKNNLEKTIAKIYIWFFPFKMITIFSGLSSIFIGLANRTSFLFFILGMIIYIMHRKIIIPGSGDNSLFSSFFIMYLICDVTSIIMAVIQFNSLGYIGGESTFDAILPKILYSFAYMVFIIYNAHVFEILPKEEISKIIEQIITVCIVLGFLQILVIFIGGPAAALNNILSNIFGSWSNYSISQTQRIALITSEPATIAGFLGAFLFPYVYSKVIENGFTKKRIIQLILLAIIMYYTKSSTGYSLFAVEFFVFGAIYLKQSNSSLAVKFIFVFFMVIAIIGFVMLALGDSIISENISRILVDKIFSKDNTSTATRKVPLYVNWGAFTEHPIFGVGNGVQGFYYEKYFPAWAHQSIWAEANYIRSGSVLFDGALFFPSFLSGYGIVGVFLLALFVLGCIKIIKLNRSYLGYFYPFYILAGVGIVVYGFSSNFGGEYWVWFVLSIPFAVCYIRNHETLSKESDD